jgi:NTP pyrophosphatase (non-canonical NTP hydrolase)
MQRRVKDFCNEFNLNCSVESRVLDIISELRELSKKILKSNMYGKAQLKIVSDNLNLEIFDRYFSLLYLVNQLEVNLDDACQKVLRKYKEKFSTKSSINSN